MELLGDRPRTSLLRDPWFGVLLVFVGVLYLARLDTAPLRGEETRWARVSQEMREGGDWVVPRQQGEPFLSRPPLGPWLIGLSSKALGSCSTLAVRLPTAFSSIAIVLLLYGYGRRILSTAGALTAALSYATFGLSIVSGRFAETDTLFTALVASSLIVWHGLYAARRPPWMAWAAGYGLAALGTLAKGPQAPTYFVAVTGVFLLCTRDWRTLFHWGHLVGMAVYAGILGAWLVPFWLELGTRGVRSVFTSDVGLRYVDFHWAAYARHLLTYPVEVAVCLLPWSPVLLAYIRTPFRRSLAPLWKYVAFWVVCILVTFPTCWLVPNARGRYYQPLFPILALLVGVVIDRALDARSVVVPAQFAWKWLLRGTALASVIGATVILAAWAMPWAWLATLTQSTRMTFAFGAMALVCAWLIGRAATAAPSLSSRVNLCALFAVAALAGFTSIGPVLSGEVRGATTGEEAIVRLRELVPRGTPLVSLGPVNHQFSYYYQDPIGLRPSIREGARLEPGDTYFCFGSCDEPYVPRELPFPWEPVAIVSCERAVWMFPRYLVVIGRRLDEAPGATPRIALDQVETLRKGGKGRLR